MFNAVRAVRAEETINFQPILIVWSRDTVVPLVLNGLDLGGVHLPGQWRIVALEFKGGQTDRCAPVRPLRRKTRNRFAVANQLPGVPDVQQGRHRRLGLVKPPFAAGTWVDGTRWK